MAHGIADVLSVTCLALKDDAETNDRRQWRPMSLRQLRRHGWNFKGARNANHDGLLDPRAGKFSSRRSQHAVDVAAVIFGGHDGKPSAGRPRLRLLNSLEHKKMWRAPVSSGTGVPARVLIVPLARSECPCHTAPH